MAQPPPLSQIGIGVVAPYDFALDRELWRWAPDDVSLHLTRLPYAPLAATTEMAIHISESALVAAGAMDVRAVSPAVTAYACTSGSFIGGRAGEAALVAAMKEAGAPDAVTTSGALLIALRRLGLARIAVVTPYTPDLTHGLSSFLGEAGIEVVASAGLGLTSEIWMVPYETTAGLVRATDSAEAEAVFVSCTNLPTYDLIATLEADLGKPVLTANQVTMWCALTIAGRQGRRPGSAIARIMTGELTAVDAAEYADRLRRVRDKMRERSLAALVVSDPANLFYLTGYDAWSFYTPQCLVIPAETEPHLFARAQDAAGATFTCNLPAEQIHGYPEELVHRPDVHPFDWIAGAARDLVPAGELVGVEGDAHFFSPRGYFALANGLPGNRLVDSAELVNWVRLVKSPSEVGRLRIAGAIAERAMRIACEQLRPGRRQCDLVAEILAAQAIGVPGHGGEYPALVPLLPTGDASGTPHLTWSDRPFRIGEATTIELAGVFGRYHAPLARTVMLGDPPQRLIDTAHVVADAMQSTLDAIRPGVTGGVVHEAFDRVIRSHGLRKDSRIGYSIGIGYPPDWGERTVSLRREETTELAAGMAFHIILGMWMDGWGYELSEPIVVTATGVERLTDLPHELTIRR